MLALTWLVGDYRCLSAFKLKEATGQTIAFLLGQPRITLEQVVFALSRQVHFHLLNEPSAIVRYTVVAQLRTTPNIASFSIA